MTATGPRFQTRDEAVFRLIVEPITASLANADDFDMEAIADAVIDCHDDGYGLATQFDVDEDGYQDYEAFWITVSKHAK